MQLWKAVPHRNFDLNVDLTDSIHVDDVAPSTMKFGDAKNHAPFFV